MKDLFDWIENHIGTLSDATKYNIKISFNDFSTNKNHELSQFLLNKIHNKTKQKNLGITYTPHTVRNIIIENCFSIIGEDFNLNNFKICDPACGSGLFIIDIIKKLIISGYSIKVISKKIYLIDIDFDSVAIALTNIYCYLNDAGLFDKTLKFNAKCIDFFDDKEFYNLIITNPPYVKLQNIQNSQRLKLRAKYPLIFTGSISLASLFLKKMQDSLLPDGVIGVITQNNIFTSNSGINLRNQIKENLLQIDSFGSRQIFDSVNAYTCLLYLSKKENDVLKYRKIESEMDFKKNPALINIKNLNNVKWRLGTEYELNLLSRMESKGIPLGKLCRIWVGIATQFDKAFTVFCENGEWFGVTPYGTKNNIEGGIVKKLVRISDFSSEYDLSKNNRGVIYPYTINSGKAVPLSEADLVKNYPRASAYLHTWKNELLSREKGRIPHEDWFKWGRVQSMIPVKGKLLTKTFSRGPDFFFDSSDSLFSNGYALTLLNNDFCIQYIQKVLNSKAFLMYSQLTSFEIDGGYQCYQKNFIEKFCIPNISFEMQIRLLSDEKVEEFLYDHFQIE